MNVVLCYEQNLAQSNHRVAQVPIAPFLLILFAQMLLGNLECLHYATLCTASLIKTWVVGPNILLRNFCSVTPNLHRPSGQDRVNKVNFSRESISGTRS